MSDIKGFVIAIGSGLAFVLAGLFPYAAALVVWCLFLILIAQNIEKED